MEEEEEEIQGIQRRRSDCAQYAPCPGAARSCCCHTGASAEHQGRSEQPLHRRSMDKKPKWGRGYTSSHDGL